MFDILNPYESNDHFFYSANQNLKDVCNAPKKGVGVFLVYELKDGRINLVYVGASGKINQNGKLQIPKDGLYGELVNGIQFEQSRKISWKEKLISENIDALDVYWWETLDKDIFTIPNTVKGIIIQDFFDLNGTLPRWNKEF